MRGWGENWDVYLFAPLFFEDVRKHIRQCMRVRNERDDNYILFRFYDPRVFVDIVSSFSLEQLTDFFGPIEYYLLEHIDTKQMVRSQLTAQTSEDHVES